MFTCHFSAQEDSKRIEGSKLSYLSVLAPPIVKLRDLSMTVYESKSFELTCEALAPDTGHPDVGKGVNFTWYKDGAVDKTESKIFVFSSQYI